MKIFISYSSRDKDVYNNLTDALIKRGHIVFNADLLGKGKKIDNILNELGSVAEGVKTSKALCELADKLHLEVPVSSPI